MVSEHAKLGDGLGRQMRCDGVGDGLEGLDLVAHGVDRAHDLTRDLTRDTT